jgi:preprotein translocase subunit SecF
MEKMEPVPSAVEYQFDKPMRDVAPIRVEKAIPVRQASQATEKPARKDISRYVQAWADPSVASSAAEKVAEIMGSEYAYPEIIAVLKIKMEILLDIDQRFPKN